MFSWHLLHFNWRVHGIYRRLSGAVLLISIRMIVACTPSWLCVCLLLSLSSALQESRKPGGLCDAYSFPNLIHGHVARKIGVLMLMG